MKTVPFDPVAVGQKGYEKRSLQRKYALVWSYLLMDLTEDAEENLMYYLYQSLQQGWLRVSDVAAPPAHWISCGLPFAEQTTWNPKFCIVTDSQLLLLDKGKAMLYFTHEVP